VVLHPPAGTVGGEPFVVYGNMRVVYGVDTLDYVPGPEFLADVGRRAAPGTTFIFRRRPPGKGHGYRAVAERNGKVLLYVDETETKDSVKWLVLHELAHILVTAQPTLAETLRSQPRPSGYPKDDAAHEAVIEEQVANAYADLLAPVPGLDRRWWRKRTQAMGYGEAAPPLPSEKAAAAFWARGEVSGVAWTFTQRAALLAGGMYLAGGGKNTVRYALAGSAAIEAFVRTYALYDKHKRAAG